MNTLLPDFEAFLAALSTSSATATARPETETKARTFMATYRPQCAAA